MMQVHLAFVASKGRVFGEASVQCLESVWDKMFIVSTVDFESHTEGPDESWPVPYIHTYIHTYMHARLHILARARTHKLVTVIVRRDATICFCELRLLNFFRVLTFLWWFRSEELKIEN
jgi:hypothetical protein